MFSYILGIDFETSNCESELTTLPDRSRCREKSENAAVDMESSGSLDDEDC